MVFVTFYFAYGRHGISMWDSKHMDVRVYRISQIPTQEMIDANLTSWRNSWNASDPRSYNSEFYLIDNEMPVRPHSKPMSSPR